MNVCETFFTLTELDNHHTVFSKCEIFVNADRKLMFLVQHNRFTEKHLTYLKPQNHVGLRY